MTRAEGVSELCISPDCSLRRAIECIDRSRRGVTLVVDAERRLLDVVTDGDVRRAVLAEIDLDTPVRALRERRVTSPYAAPVAARAGWSDGALLAIMRRRRIRHLPLLDDAERVVGLATLDDVLPERPPPLEALVMAGGRGTRLRPLTEDVPKPMLPVGDRPLLEHILAQLRSAGIGRVHISTHYRSEQIARHFGDGERFGMDVRYLREERALGTAGALTLLEAPQETVLVINGDVLTNVDFRAMWTYHQEHKADITIATRRYDLQVPYGVIECRGSWVRKLREKPEMRFFVNAGIYLIEPSVLRDLPVGESIQMTDLIARGIESGRSVVSFPIHEYWAEIGQLPDYARAQDDVRAGCLER